MVSTWLHGAFYISTRLNKTVARAHIGKSVRTAVVSSDKRFVQEAGDEFGFVLRPSLQVLSRIESIQDQAPQPSVKMESDEIQTTARIIAVIPGKIAGRINGGRRGNFRGRRIVFV